MAFAPYVVMGIGAIVSAVGKHKAANAAKAAGVAQSEVDESQAQLSDYNAEVADQQAQDAIDRGTLEANKIRTAVRGMIGAQTTAFAGSGAGVDVGFGSAVDVAADTARLGELDALTTMTNAQRSAWGYKVEAEDQRRAAAIQRQGGKMAIATGKANASADNWNAGGTLLTTAGSLYLDYKHGNA
jgi:hypothetical protein